MKEENGRDGRWMERMVWMNEERCMDESRLKKMNEENGRDGWREWNG